MSDDLRRAMDAAIPPSGAPDVSDIWRAGRRRRSTRRWASIGGSLAAVLLVAGIAVRLTTPDDSETVRSGAVSARCNPPPRMPGPSEGLYQPPSSPVPVPATPSAMVNGRRGPAPSSRPRVVARVRVVSTQRGGGPNERLAHVEVVDPVRGATVGDRLTISDAGLAAVLGDLKAAHKVIEQTLDDLQTEIDELSRPLADLDVQIAKAGPHDPGYQQLLADRAALASSIEPKRTKVEAQITDYQQRLEILQLSERLTATSTPMGGTSCHRFATGDDLIVALIPQGAGTNRYELTGPSSFFLITDGKFSPELDAARRSVPGWTDSELLRLARTSTPDEFLDRLREAAGN